MLERRQRSFSRMAPFQCRGFFEEQAACSQTADVSLGLASAVPLQ